MYVVAVDLNGQTRYFVSHTKDGTQYSETVGSWTPIFNRKLAERIAKDLAKQSRLVCKSWIEEVVA